MEPGCQGFRSHDLAEQHCGISGITYIEDMICDGDKYRDDSDDILV